MYQGRDLNDSNQQKYFYFACEMVRQCESMTLAKRVSLPNLVRDFERERKNYMLC